MGTPQAFVDVTPTLATVAADAQHAKAEELGAFVKRAFAKGVAKELAQQHSTDKGKSEDFRDEVSAKLEEHVDAVADTEKTRGEWDAAARGTGKQPLKGNAKQEALPRPRSWPTPSSSRSWRRGACARPAGRLPAGGDQEPPQVPRRAEPRQLRRGRRRREEHAEDVHRGRLHAVPEQQAGSRQGGRLHRAGRVGRVPRAAAARGARVRVVEHGGGDGRDGLAPGPDGLRAVGRDRR